MVYTNSVRMNRKGPLTWSLITSSIRISFVSLEARAFRLMVLSCAERVESANAYTRITTPLVHTSTVRRTILVDHTLRTAAGRCTKHTRQATANGTVLVLSAFSIRSTWAWYARIGLARWFFCHCCRRI